MILDPHREETKCCIPLELQKLHKYTGFSMSDCMAGLDGVFGFGESAVQQGFFQGTLFRYYCGLNTFTPPSNYRMGGILKTFQLKIMNYIY